MISILIPCYDYDVYNLVCELKNQCDKIAIEYEIICQDDASNSSLNSSNSKINNLKNCLFFENKENLGRAKNRNLLASKSIFEWLLFIDCDTLPVSANYIYNYISLIKENIASVAFGGIEYSNEVPDDKKTLRWVYGKKREAINVEARIKNQYATALTSNLLIKKTVFNKILFQESIIKYGYEDIVFVASIEKNNIPIKHLDNPLFHLGLDTSIDFLEKTKTAIENLLEIHYENPEFVNHNKVVKVYKFLMNTKLIYFFCFFFKKLKPKIEKNLLSNKPSIFQFDLYKLGYFCCLKLKRI